MPKPRYITIGLLWHSLVSGNLGVGALTESNIAIVRKIAEELGLKVRFLVLGSGDGLVEMLRDELRASGHDLESHRVRVFRREFRELVRRCDVVLDIGEGDSFADIYGFKRFFFYWLSKNIVCSLGKPLILAPQTIGPFDGLVARTLAKQVLSRCTRIFARDNLSSNYLKQLGVTGNTEEAIDVAFRLPFQKPVGNADGITCVGINVSGLLFNGGYTGGNQFSLTIDYGSTMRQIIAHFVAMPKVDVHLIGHVIEPHMLVEDDIRTAQQLAKEFPTVVVAPAFHRPSEAKSYIAGMDFFVGARMHACIAAFSSGIPVVPIAYSRKFNGLFTSLGYARIADGKTMSSEQVLATVSSGWEERKALACLIAQGNQIAEKRLREYELYLSNILGDQLRGA